MNIKLLFPVLFIVAACVVTLLLTAKKGKARTGAYRLRKLMTDNEEEFFGRLVAALPEHYIFPQVAMSAILQPTSSDGKTAHGDRLRIAQQRVDYLVCTNRCEVVAVVELDDRSHSQAKDQLRDARLEQAGIRTIRFQSRAKPKVDAIRAAIFGAAADDVKSPIEPSRADVAALADASETKSVARTRRPHAHPTQDQVASSQD